MRLDPQQVIRNYLSAYYFEKNAKNSKFSLRAFAKKLDITSSALSEILKGKRKISKKKALLFAEVIKLSPKDLKVIADVYSTENRLESLKERPNPLREIVIGPDQFKVMSEWLHFAIVSLMRTEGFINDSDWIANRLGVTANEVIKAINSLKEAGSIVQNENNELIDQKVCYRTSTDFPEVLVNKRMTDGLNNAIKVIASDIPYHFGAFSTISTDPSKLKAANELTEDFVKRLSLFLADGKKTEVYELNIQLFPLSKINKECPNT